MPTIEVLYNGQLVQKEHCSEEELDKVTQELITHHQNQRKDFELKIYQEFMLCS